MNIWLDLSVLQTPHRMRGIGAVAKEFINNISDSNKKKHKYVIFLCKKDKNLALELLNLEGMDYTISTLKNSSAVNIKFPWKFKKINGLLNSIADLSKIYFGENKISEAIEIDTYLQFDQQIPMPKFKNKVKKVVILYDIIPYVLKDQYLWDYKTARKNNLGIISSLRRSYLRVLYRKKITGVINYSDKLIAISQYTKDDFIKYFGVKKQIDVTHLGINIPLDNKVSYPLFENFTENCWGYFKNPINLKEKPFLLFVGGVDPRRKIKDLFAAYNIIKAQGNDIRLVLAGDIMHNPHVFPDLDTRNYAMASSYLEDVVFLGYVNENQRNWLYQNASAFIYPSIYEGFGLPLLEAASFGCPVITYDNTSIHEVCGDSVIYARGYIDIAYYCKKLLENRVYCDQYSQLGKNKSRTYSWEATSEQIIKKITNPS